MSPRNNKKASWPKAKLINVNGGTFNDVRGDMLHYHVEGELHLQGADVGLHTLRQSISLGAMHDSSERFPAPKCHPQTRQSVLKLITEWIEDDDSQYSIFWVYGPAGTGKSSIFQSIAEFCRAKSGINCGASFFFSRGKIGRDQASNLFSTIGYQLAYSIPGLRDQINNIMMKNPILPSKPPDMQLRNLIVDPISCLTSHSSPTPLIIIDGLDECEGHNTQQLILNLIAEALEVYKVPLRFLVASRPEAHIRETFDSSTLLPITRRVVLDESFNPNRDIEIFLRDGFNIIYKKNLDLLAHMDALWPGQGVIDLLVQKASGQFIYAATVLKFVGAEYYHPGKQVQVILDICSPCHRTAFMDLDILYHQILSTCPDPDTLILVLGTILSLHCPQPLNVIETILQMEVGELSLVLRGLRSLVRIPGLDIHNTVPEQEDTEDDESENGLRFYHASFRDFLVDKNRSGPFYVDLREAHERLTVAGFHLITKHLAPSSNESHDPCLEAWGYLKWHLSPHFWACSEEVRNTIAHHLRETASLFCTAKLREEPCGVIFEALHCAMTALVRTMYTKRKWLEGRNHHCDPALECTLENLINEYPEDPEKNLDPTMSEVYHQYRHILDSCYDTVFSASTAMQDLLSSVPGFLALRVERTVEDLADILNVEVETLCDLVEINKQFIRFSHYSGRPSPSIVLKVHVVDYLRDETRSRYHYHNRKVHQIAICHSVLSFMFENPWTAYAQSNEKKREYFIESFHEHIAAVELDPDDSMLYRQALMGLVEYMKRLDFYHDGLRDAPYLTLIYMWFTITPVLRWVQRLQEYLENTEDDDMGLEDGLEHIIDRIYGQILVLEKSTNEQILTVCPPYLESFKRSLRQNHEPANADLEVFQLSSAESKTIEEGDNTPMRVAEDFLLFEDFMPSLAAYITNPSRSSYFYINPATYHTQLAEYWLERCRSRYGKEPLEDAIEIRRRKYAGEHWKMHLVQALPSDAIFACLRTVYGFSLIGASHPHIASLRAIVAWLETLPAPPLDVYLRWQTLLLEEEEYENERVISGPAAGEEDNQMLRSLFHWFMSYFQEIGPLFGR